MTQRATIAAAIAVALIAPLLMPASYVVMAGYIGMYAIVALGLVLLTGVCGLMSFGQAAFVGLGAYTSAVLATRTDIPVVLAYIGSNAWLSLAFALLLTAFAAILIGLITLRLSGHFLALSTLAWGLSIYYLFGTLDLFGRYAGIGNIPSISVLGFEFETPLSKFYLIAGFYLLAALAVRNLLDSRQGRAISTLKGGTLMAEAMGINVRWLRLCVFVIAALLAALAGWLYAYSQQFVAPSPFSLHASINYVFMSVIGGIGHVWGTLVGAATFTLLESWFQKDISRSLGLSGNLDQIVFGLAIFIIVLKRPQGLWPLLMMIFDRTVPSWQRAKAIEPEPLSGRTLPRKDSVLLKVSQVSKHFGGLIANDRIDLEVWAGQIVALIGPNGAGKSTLFNCIAGTYPATAGEITFFDHRIDGLASREIARLGLSRTFQHVRILPEMSVLENVAIGAHMRGRAGFLRCALRLDRDEECKILGEAAYQLRRVGLEDSAFMQAGALALGSQRILEIARALSTDPVLLLLDEPAAGLRFNEKQRLAEFLRQLKEEGLSILLVEHDMEFLMSLADHVIVLESGKKISEGTPQVVQRDPAVIDAYLGGVD
ncbi:ABC transporter permease subunit [Pseudorhodoplanes sp.]|uniref:branched-chain amino acid ABC transporter ATP-binding protein/permease n=1 Tax=Pseudorhodoplanes sp. TaxID=1934341 RepID=UPI003D114D38